MQWNLWLRFLQGLFYQNKLSILKQNKNMIRRFVLYGLCGMLIEVFWTSLNSLIKGDRRLTGQTYLWMFPIYGSAVFLEPLCFAVSDMNFAVRGIIYMVCIFAAEFLSGYLIESVVGVCPWDYNKARYNVCGIIRLDYAPCWFVVGLLFEQGMRIFV